MVELYVSYGAPLEYTANNQCGIEYNPTNHRNTYGTARILYGDRASADRALYHEVSYRKYIISVN